MRPILSSHPAPILWTIDGVTQVADLAPTCPPHANDLYDPLATLNKAKPGCAKPLAKPLLSWTRQNNRVVKRAAVLDSISPQAITLMGAIANILLSALKLVAGTLTGSAALIADAGHSCSDLITDGICLIATYAPAFERACTLGIASMLGLAGVAMVGTGVTAVLSTGAQAAASAAGAFAAPTLDSVALLVSVISIVVKELLFRATHAIGVRCKSSSLVANAHHHRSDAMSSIAAALGTLGALLGFRMMDPAAAAVVGVMVLKLGLETAAEALGSPAGHMQHAH